MSGQLYFACGMDQDDQPELIIPWNWEHKTSPNEFNYFLPAYDSFIKVNNYGMPVTLLTTSYDEFGIVTPIQYDEALFEELKNNYYLID